MATQKANHTNDLLTGSIPATLKRMTVPMMLGMVMLMSFGLVDTFFIGMLGTEELAAISFTLPVTFTLISLVIGLGIGTSAVVANALGKKQPELARSYGSAALYLAGFLVTIFAFVLYLNIDWIFKAMGAKDSHLIHIHDYLSIWCLSAVCLAFPMVGNSILRASGDTKTPSLIMASGGAINAVLDPILIFGWGPFPALGIQGAAIATLISWLIGAGIIVYLLAVKRNLINTQIMPLEELKECVSKIMKIGLPAAGANMLTPLAGTLLTAVVADFGSAAVAAWGVGSRIESIACILVLALSMSLPPFISQNFGAEQLNRVASAFKLTLKFVMVWQLGVWLLLLLAADLIGSVFSSEPEVIEAIALFIWIVPIGYGFQGVVILTNSSFNAVHKPMQALILNAARLFVFFVPFAWIGSKVDGLVGLFWGCVIANIAIAVVAYRWFTKELTALSKDCCKAAENES